MGHINKEGIVMNEVYQLLVYSDKRKVAGKSCEMKLGTNVTKNGSVSELPIRAANR
jgi:hypothetical protein